MRASILGSATVLTAMAAPAAASEVTITVTNMRSTEGVVRACITALEKAFPKCKKDPESLRTVVPAGETVTITFKDVKPGKYAIALLHDENNNGKADRALGMMPKEGYGFSRDAPVRMAPPKFKDAVFDMGSAPQKFTIKMRYFL
ncbi:DUF2141 domain-containing protein [Erythrobacter sp. WH158]|uniref:DUF2141 domain-containing protein n=2 Tax=Erythrobacter crassostreae TaxID=2828328 RepID=A0A9X1JLT2_9SPHN|nr:DUF2141 domain-containing protein [Erythrobacter crassostrea]